MTARTLRTTGLAALVITLAGAPYQAQTASPRHTLTFAELTYGQTIRAVVAAPGGGAWFGGRTCSTTLPTTPTAIQRTKSGGCHGILGKVTPDGAVVYLSYLGGGDAYYEDITALAVDASGNLYVGGNTTAPDFPVTSDAYDTTCGDDGSCMIYKKTHGIFLNGPAMDGFVTKLSPAADRILYSTYFGGGDDEIIGSLAVDARGRIHISGATLSRNLPVTANALQTGYVGGANPDGDPWFDAFYARLAAGGGSLEYGTYLGGHGNELAEMALDSTGNAYVAGSTTGPDFPVLNAVQPANASPPGNYLTSDGWLARFGDTAAYSTYVGGAGDDYVYGIAVVDGDVYLAGMTCSSDFPGASDPATACRAFIAEGTGATGAVRRTVTLGARGPDYAQNLVVDANHAAYITGTANSSTPAFPTTVDAYQRASAGSSDAFFSIVDFSGATPSLSYSTYLGGPREEHGTAVALDDRGGAYFGGYVTRLSSSADFPSYPARPQPPAEAGSVQPFIAHVSAVQSTGGGAGSEIVIYARDASAVAGSWQLASDSTAAGGTRIWNPDAGVAKLSAPAASPANYFEVTFDAPAGVPYHLWLRMKADADSWQNDSVFAQFSDSVDSAGNPVWRIGSANATVVSLEDCSGCGEHGWGWNDNGYNSAGTMVTFAAGGRHTLRIQQREDGISIDQIVLSSAAYASHAPGANKDDTTILDASGAAPDLNEVVRYAGDAAAVAGSWQSVADTSAAGGTRLFNPDAGVGKLPGALASPANYFDVTFTAKAGTPYHLWLRMKAQNDSWQNDSVFVQFSDSVDAWGSAVWRTGTTSSTVVSLEDCSGCGELDWGWNDNGYGGAGTLVRFATSGTHTIRVQQREDGISIDQIVLSAVKYLNAAPGAAKSDTTIVPK